MSNKNQERKQALKQMIESMAESLGKKGIQITSGAIIDPKEGTVEGFGEKPPKEVIDKIMQKFGNPKTEAPRKSSGNQVNDDIKDIAKFIANKILDTVARPEGKQEEEEDHDPCLCENCNRYESFEKIYQNAPGILDYNTVELGGKPFGIKYYRSNDGETEDMIVRDLSRENKESATSLTLEQLQEGLNLAIQHKEFKQAQEFLDAIQQIKTK